MDTVPRLSVSIHAALDSISCNTPADTINEGSPAVPSGVGCWDYPCADCTCQKSRGEQCACDWTCTCDACNAKRAKRTQERGVYAIVLVYIYIQVLF